MRSEKLGPGAIASTSSSGCMEEEDEATCGSTSDTQIEEFWLEVDRLNAFGDLETIEIYGYVEWKTAERIEIIGRREVCIQGVCSYPPSVEILDDMLRPELGGSNAGLLDWILEKIFPKATAPITICTSPKLVLYRDVTKDTPIEIRPAKAAGVFTTLYPNTTRTGDIDVDITWSDGTREIYTMEAMSPAGTAQIKETKTVGTGRAGC